MKGIEQETLREDSEIEGAHRYAGVAVWQAFDATRRRLQDFAREQRGSVKTTTSRRTASSRTSRDAG